MRAVQHGQGDLERGLPHAVSTRRSLRLAKAVILRSLALGAVASAVFAASAMASCPIPQGTHYTGTWETGHELPFGGFAATIGSGTFDSISKEFVETAPGTEFHFNAITEYTGTYYELPLHSVGTISEQQGRLVCAAGVAIEEIPHEKTLSTIGEYPTFEGESHAVGTYTETTISGTSENGFGEKSRYFGTFDPAAGSQGTEPGKTEVIAPFGTVASQFTIAPATSAQLPPGAVAPAGALSFSISGVPAEGTIKVVLVLPPGSQPTAIYRPVGGGVYEQYPADKTTLLGNLITLELTDNESPWDENPEPGVIQDPVVPVQAASAGSVRRLRPFRQKWGPRVSARW